MTCVEHTQAGDKGGYGHTKIGGKSITLHRKAYCEHNNVSLDSIAGKVVRHSCDNSRCITGQHLLLGTHADNMLDMRVRQRNAHRKLTQEQADYCRKVYVKGHPEFGQSALGRRFGVVYAAIARILANKTY